ncbi:MAG TPA: hypothetical protein PKM73_15830 [Verrucomicrobiota bacterium]|nr:hypothetical protein [Verrucomicrobiota bacterium]
MKPSLKLRPTRTPWLAPLLALCPFLPIATSGAQAALPPPVADSAAEPVRYVGREQTDKRLYDGALRHAVGVHCYQALRANRACPPEGGAIGWTYNHQPYLAYWQDRFYLQYLSTPKSEHVPPGRTLLMTSTDGRHWSHPQVIFPEYALPDITNAEGHLPAGTPAIMHQRMGFYVAPNGRLLTLAFYSFCMQPLPQHGPNKGQGLGRVVREIHANNTLGPIYFIRYNRHAGWNETNTTFPFYKSSTDSGFVAACDALLQDKLMTLPWWEEDRATDGFYTLRLDKAEPKAPSFVHRPDGAVLGVWKAHYALSPDEGQSWTRLVGAPTLTPCGAKTWVQRTGDGRYALVYNHSLTRNNRFPLVVMTSDDCRDFADMLCLHGEVPPRRFAGLYKNAGPQYVRGIEEGNGRPPGAHLWSTYSMNKEDIWVTRTRVPVTGMVTHHVQEAFDGVESTAQLESWNLYAPQWAPIGFGDDPQQSGNRCLVLRDEDPYDYALAERAFPESSRVRIEFRALAERVGHGVLEAEVQDRHGHRPLKVRLDGPWLAQDQMSRWVNSIPVPDRTWLTLRLDINCTAGTYDLALNGNTVGVAVKFAEPAGTVERLVFRTGPYRGDVRALFVEGEHATLGYTSEDLPGADQRVPLSVYYIDDVKTAAVGNP